MRGNNDVSDVQPPSKSGLWAFAVGAVCVSALVLAFSLGRRWPLSPTEVQPVETPLAANRAAPASLSEVRRRGLISAAELPVDRGLLDAPQGPTPKTNNTTTNAGAGEER